MIHVSSTPTHNSIKPLFIISSILFGCIHRSEHVTCHSVFFSEAIASEQGAGSEILQGTSLRMPKIPDYESFRRIIDKVPNSQLILSFILCYAIFSSLFLSFLTTQCSCPILTRPLCFVYPITSSAHCRG